MTPQQEFLADLVEATGLDVSVVPRAVSYQVIVHDARRTHLGIVTLREDSGRVWVIRSGDVAARLDLADPRLTERLREALLAASSA